ncbi:mavicyanin [Populus alba x Populus x berolinensis]|nr:mavicyanin [Populus alba x Populus x berolinensis]
MAVVYQVGDSAGWTSMGQVDYQDWAANKNFHGGDTLVFNYNNQFHNLGYYYFICGYLGHCQAGQKIDILIVPANSNLSPAASPSSASSLYFSNLS